MDRYAPSPYALFSLNSAKLNQTVQVGSAWYRTRPRKKARALRGGKNRSTSGRTANNRISTQFFKLFRRGD